MCVQEPHSFLTNGLLITSSVALAIVTLLLTIRKISWTPQLEPEPTPSRLTGAISKVTSAYIGCLRDKLPLRIDEFLWRDHLASRCSTRRVNGKCQRHRGPTRQNRTCDGITFTGARTRQTRAEALPQVLEHVQGQMAVTKRARAYFVVFTFIDVQVIELTFNERFWCERNFSPSMSITSANMWLCSFKLILLVQVCSVTVLCSVGSN